MIDMDDIQRNLQKWLQNRRNRLRQKRLRRQLKNLQKLH